MSVRWVIAMAVATGLTGFVSAGTLSAQERMFVPKGHSYAPSSQRLPTINSGRYRYQSKADVFESEIYRVQRDRAILEGEIQRHILHDLNGGTDFTPRY